MTSIPYEYRPLETTLGLSNVFYSGQVTGKLYSYASYLLLHSYVYILIIDVQTLMYTYLVQTLDCVHYLMQQCVHTQEQ